MVLVKAEDEMPDQGWKDSERVMIANAVHDMLQKLGYTKLGAFHALEIAKRIQAMNEEAHQKEGTSTVPTFMDSTSKNL